MASEQGYSNQKKKGKAQFKTIHSAGSDAFAEQVIPKYLYNVNLLDIAITGIQDILGTNGQVEFWKVTMVAHNASVGNILQIKTPSVASLTRFEFEITSIIDVDNFLILPISNAKPAIGDTGLIKNWVSAASDSDGNPQIAIAPAPIKFLLDGVTTDVSKDTVTPANSKLLPTENLIAQASLSSIDGKFTTLNAKDFATSAKQDTGNSSLSSIDGKFTTLNAKDFATAAKQDTGNVSLNSIDGKFTTLNAKDFATSAKQDTGNSSLSSIDGKLQNNGLLDSANSTATPLGANAVFTGTWTDITNYNSIALGVRTDQASANDGLVVQYSTDGITVHHTHLYNIVANQGIGFNLVGEFKYFRISYTNGAIAQTSFVLQSILKTNPLFPSQYRLTNPLTDQTQATVSRSLIFGKTTGGGGGYVDVKVTPSGSLTTESTVTGSVSVTNFPATQAVTGTFFQATQPVSGSVSVSNFPATQNVAEQTQSGTITNIQKSVGLTAVRATVSGSAPGAARKKLMIKPSKNNTGAIYLGSSSVTISDGLEIIGPDRLEFLLDASDYYLISDTAAQVVEILEVV
jgi:hypothetical protein